jgi:hypothetical protein
VIVARAHARDLVGGLPVANRSRVSCLFSESNPGVSRRSVIVGDDTQHTAARPPGDPMSTTRRSHRLAAFAALGALTLAACGGDDDVTPAAAETETMAERR